jgi:alkylation response protein AidB-like acyl-CoA dehydrogenase
MSALAQEAGAKPPLDEGELEGIRDSVRQFVLREVTPIAARLDREGKEMPDELLRKLGELGYLGLVLPENYGGGGLDLTAMVAVTEELSRGWLSVGSVMTRSIITGTLLAAHGTPAQKEKWLPRIARGEILTAAAFTEPNVGSDAGRAECRATRQPDGSWRIRGQKTWCTLANRASLLTVLARTDPDAKPPRKGLSLLLAEKAPGDGFQPPELMGERIETVGYHGMHCFGLSFQDFPVPGENLVGEEPNRGFYQLMATYEVARIQTAARAVGVAQAALDAAVKYARERTQFGRPLAEHQAIRHKIAEMAARLEAARQLTYFAARKRSAGGRTDREASMAKVIATEMVEFVTREAMQIHGGYGYSTEFEVQRFWRDAKVFSLFEGTTEIQLEVIGRSLAGRGEGG